MVEGSEATIFTKTSFTVLISFLSYLSREILFDRSPWTWTLERFSISVTVYNYYNMLLLLKTSHCLVGARSDSQPSSQ